jgi:hypothetical protein
MQQHPEVIIYLTAQLPSTSQDMAQVFGSWKAMLFENETTAAVVRKGKKGK